MKIAKVSAGKCCPVLKVALSRQPANGLGLVTGTRINFKTGESGDAIVVRFRKGKKDEPHANTTFAWLRFCPFCGTPTEGALAPDKLRVALELIREDWRPNRRDRRGRSSCDPFTVADNALKEQS